MDLLKKFIAFRHRFKPQKSDQLGLALTGLCFGLSVFMLGWQSHHPFGAAEQQAQAACRQGFAQLASHNHQSAKTHFRQALRFADDWAPAHLGLGALAYISGKWNEAHTHTQLALEFGPDQAEAYALLYKVARAQQDSIGAQQALRTCLDHRPDYGPAHFALGKIHLKRQDYALALDYFEQYLNLNRALHEQALMHCIGAGKSELADYLSALLAHPSPLATGRLSNLILPYLHRGDAIYGPKAWQIDDQDLGSHMALALERLGQEQRASKFYQWAAAPIP